MILGLVDEAVQAGARQREACAILEIDVTALQRWRRQGIGNDRRAGPKTTPGNKLGDAERKRILATVNSPEHRELSAKQIVPKLADQNVYLASESTIYRILRAEKQLKHRERSKAPTGRRPDEFIATGPNQVWCWDITYLRSSIRGVYFYLYVVIDVWSRKIVAHAVHPCEDGKLAAALVERACAREGIRRGQLTLHQDNGAAMKSGNFLALLQWLGVAASFSRPGVSDDNPFIESAFRTLKYRPNYPDRPFGAIEDAARYADEFVRWYNCEHLHSGIKFVTPEARHARRDVEILARRKRVYERAKARRPERWAGNIRDWTPIETVTLNPAAGRTHGAA